MLFWREEKHEMFCKEIFHTRYWKNNDILPQIEIEAAEGDESNIIFENDETVTQDTLEDESLDEKEKYKIATPILLRIGSLISAHSTNQFLGYVEELEEVERKVRRGQSILINTDHVAGIPADNTTLGDPGSIPVVPSTHGITIDREHATMVSTDAVSYTTEPTDSVPSTVGNSDIPISTTSSSRFSNLTFKERLTTKGRPKKRSKQLSFKKTKMDIKVKKKPRQDFKVLVQEANNPPNELFQMSEQRDDIHMQIDAPPEISSRSKTMPENYNQFSFFNYLQDSQFP